MNADEDDFNQDDHSYSPKVEALLKRIAIAVMPPDANRDHYVQYDLKNKSNEKYPLSVKINTGHIEEW